VLVALQLGTGGLIRHARRRPGVRRLLWIRLVWVMWWLNFALLWFMLLTGTSYQTVASAFGLLVWTLMGGLLSRESEWSR
jgi:hypothetical protein